MFSDWNRGGDYDRQDRAKYYKENNFDREYADDIFSKDSYQSELFNDRTAPDRYGRPDRYDRRERTERRDSVRDARTVNDRKFKNPFSKRERIDYESKADALTNGFGNNMIIYSPKTYGDVKKLIDYLKNREPIIVDLAEIKHEKGQRILDFLSGAIYALNGSMHKISGTIYLLTPDGVNIMVPTELEEKIRKEGND